MGHFYADDVVQQALDLIEQGSTISAAASSLGVPRWTVQRWKLVYLDAGQPRGQAHCQIPCPRCTDAVLDESAYAELLGWYLGDGHIARARRGVLVLRIYNDAQYVHDNARILQILERVKPGSRPSSHQRGQLVISLLYWKHWKCLFPQHGPGRKHERRIQLEPWQRHIVEAQPAAFLRGLFHSDGCRVKNWATRSVAGQTKRYNYPVGSSRTSPTTSENSAAGRLTWWTSSGAAAAARIFPYQGARRSPASTP